MKKVKFRLSKQKSRITFSKYLYIVVLCLIFIQCKHLPKENLLTYGGKQDSVSLFPDTPEGITIKDHMYTLAGYGEDAEAIYQQSLTALRQQPELIPVIYDIYKQAKESDYLLRSYLVLTLKEFRSDTALNILNEIASSAIPEEKSTDDEYSTLVNEIIIRSLAVEGISYLADSGSIAAEQNLLQLTRNKDITIKQLAIRGYLRSHNTEVSREQKEAMLIKELDQGMHWMITDKLTDIKTVPHPAMPETFDIQKSEDDKAPVAKK